MLYFAYGSNLNHFQMKKRCRDSKFLKIIELKDYKLTFRSIYRAADIEPKKNSIVPGALFEISKNDESFENGLLEYPQYTKPQIWEKKSVPDVLLSGDHTKIKDWRLSQSEAITRDRRPDLWHKYKKN